MTGDDEGRTLEIAADCSWAGDLNRLAMADGITLVHLAERRPTLEEAFFEITRNCGEKTPGKGETAGAAADADRSSGARRAGMARPMIWRAFASEWVKMRRRRLWYGSYGAITGVIVLTTIVTIAGALHHANAHGDLTLAQLAHASGLSQGLTRSGVLLGAVSFSIAAFQFGGEFAHGTLRNLLVRQPRRSVLMVGKCLAVLTFLIGAVVAATMVAICAAFVMAHLRGISTDAWTSGVGMTDLGTLLGDLTVSACGFAIIGMIAGVLLRSSVIADRGWAGGPAPRGDDPHRRHPGYGALATGATARGDRPGRVQCGTVRGRVGNRVGVPGGSRPARAVRVRQAGRDCLTGFSWRPGGSIFPGWASAVGRIA